MYCFIYRCFSFDNCFVCPLSIYTDSNDLFVIFKLFYWFTVIFRSSYRSHCLRQPSIQSLSSTCCACIHMQCIVCYVFLMLAQWWLLYCIINSWCSCNFIKVTGHYSRQLVDSLTIIHFLHVLICCLLSIFHDRTEMATVMYCKLLLFFKLYL